MGVFKEEGGTFEEVEKRQVRIFNDSADFGYPYSTVTPDLKISNLIKLVNELKKLGREYPEEKQLIRNRQTWNNDNGVSLDVVIFWERDGENYIGTKYSICFNRIDSNHPRNLHPGCDAFISVDLDNIVEHIDYY